MKFPHTITTADGKHAEVSAAIRAQILASRLAPGARLPCRPELQRQFSVSNATLQRAINTLVRDGFLEARRRGGTRVAEHPPHLTRYGIVLPEGPEHPSQWSRFWQATLWATLAFPPAPDQQLVPLYVDYNGQPSAARAAAEAEVAAGRFAGLAFLFPPFRLLDSPLLQAAGLPRVNFASEPSPWPTVRASLWVDYRGMITQALTWLAAQGRRRLAILGPPGQLGEGAEQPAQLTLVAAHGLTTRPAWQLAIAWDQVAQVRPQLAAMFNAPPADRPDALLVLDDNLLDDACAALQQLGRRIPADVAVASHWNFPNPLPRHAPIHCVGFDARALLARCIAMLDAQRRHEAVPPFALLPAVTAAEVGVPDPFAAQSPEN